MKRKIAVVVGMALLIHPSLTLKATAQTEQTAPCKDIPSCAVIGTVVIGGAIYYVIKNTVTGVVRRIPARQVVPSHRKIEPGRQEVGGTVTVIVERREQCASRARRYGRETDGGEWVVDSIEVIGTAGAPGRINPDGSIHEEPIKFRCRLRKVR